MTDEKLASSMVSKAEDLVLDAMEILEQLAKKDYKFKSQCYEKTEEAMNELTKERIESKT